MKFCRKTPLYIEEWRPIVGHEQFIEISNWGRIRTITRILSNGARRRGIIVKLDQHCAGHLYFRLIRTRVYAHRAVADAFLPNPHDSEDTIHKDDDLTNNRVDNIAWVHCDGVNFRAVEGFPKYYCTPSGRIYSRLHNRFLYPTIAPNGYYMAGLRDRSGTAVTVPVHRVIATAFLNKAEDGLIVNHKNSNKLDNRSDNLEWVTYSENAQHAVRCGFLTNSHSRIPVEARKGERIWTFVSISEAAKRGFGTRNGIERVINGITEHTRGGYQWRRIHTKKGERRI